MKIGNILTQSQIVELKKKTTGESKFVYFHLTDQIDFVSIATKFNLQTIGKNRKKLYFYTFLLTCCFNQSFWLIDVSKTDYFRPVSNKDILTSPTNVYHTAEIILLVWWCDQNLRTQLLYSYYFKKMLSFESFFFHQKLNGAC